MTLASDFEDNLREAVLNDAEDKLVGQRGNIIHEAVQQAHDRLREYGQEFDINVEPIIESFGGIDVERSQNGFTIRWGWEHEAAVYMEFGTSDHTIEGDPILSFVWEDPPAWVREEFDQARGSGGQFQSGYRVFLPEVEVSGIPESRFVRDALNWLRRELER